MADIGLPPEIKNAILVKDERRLHRPDDFEKDSKVLVYTKHQKGFNRVKKILEGTVLDNLFDHKRKGGFENKALRLKVCRSWEILGGEIQPADKREYDVSVFYDRIVKAYRDLKYD